MPSRKTFLFVSNRRTINWRLSKLYTTRSRMSSRQDRLIRRLLTQGLIDVENDRLIQHRIVSYARRNEGMRWRQHPDLPGCVIIDEPFRPESWQGYPLEG